MVPAAPASDVHSRGAAPDAVHASAASSDSARAAHDDVCAAPAVRRPVIGDTSDADNASATSSGAARDDVRCESAAARVVPNAATNIPSSDSPDAPIAAATASRQPNDGDVARGDNSTSAVPNSGAVNGEDVPTAAPDAHVAPRPIADITPTPVDGRPNAGDHPLPDAPDGVQHGAVVHDASSPDDAESHIVNDDADNASASDRLLCPDARDDEAQSGAAADRNDDADPPPPDPLRFRFELTLGPFSVAKARSFQRHLCRITKPLFRLLTFAMRNSSVFDKFEHFTMAFHHDDVANFPGTCRVVGIATAWEPIKEQAFYF